MCLLTIGKSDERKKKEKDCFFQLTSLFRMIAEAPPPPLQIAAAPKVLFFVVNALIKVTTIRAPEHPNGWPSETAPPCILTFSGESPNNFILAKPTTEKASLNSKRSIAACGRLALAKALGNAFAGAVVNHCGS